MQSFFKEHTVYISKYKHTLYIMFTNQLNINIVIYYILPVPGLVSPAV